MPETGLGGFAARNGFTAGGVYSPMTVIYPRAANDGSYPLVIIALWATGGGRGATRTGVIYVGGSQIAVTLGPTSAAVDLGWLDSGDWLTYGGTATNYGYTSLSGQAYFARSSTSGPIGSYGEFGTFTGSIGMYYRYVQVPSNPTITSVTPTEDGTAATLIFSGPADNGGSGVTGYRVQRATNAAFTQNVATINNSSGTAVLTGLTPGTRYYYRVTASNYASDASGRLGGTWSAVVAVDQPVPSGAGKRFNGTTFEDADWRRYNGTTWDELSLRRNDGTTWQEVA